jgi:hypothetical protein
VLVVRLVAVVVVMGQLHHRELRRATPEPLRMHPQIVVQGHPAEKKVLTAVQAVPVM